MATIPNFSWEDCDRATYDEKLDVVPIVAERPIVVDVVPRDSMHMYFFLMGEPIDTTEDGEPTFLVYGRTRREGAMPRYWKGSRPVTRAEFEQVDDPYRYGYMFVSCVADGTDLVCTPWSYRHGWEGPVGTQPRRGEPVRLVGALSIREERWGSQRMISYGFVDGADTLRRVCELVGHGTQGYCLRTSESGRAWSLELSSATRIWQVS